MSEEKKILVIDDEKRMAESLQQLLENYDYSVDIACSGEEGIEKLHKNDYHVAITDLRMSDVDGHDIMHFINTNMPDTRIIVITGHASTESAIEALHYKAFDYLTKPFDFELLRNAVERAFLKIEAESLREEMIRMVTHDIKIPLTSIIGFSGMIFDRKTGEMHPNSREFVDSIYLNSQKLLSLIDNFLATCKINTDRLNVNETPMNINPVIRDLIPMVELSCEKGGIELNINLDENLPEIRADENLIFRAVGNVMNNAVKYTPEGGSVSLKTAMSPASASPLHKPSLMIEVKNTGPGIPRNELSGVFEKYKRSQHIKGIEGSGLGLFVVKNIVKAHNGTVTVNSIPDNVTNFTIYLPAKS